jgi:ribosomal protein S27E
MSWNHGKRTTIKCNHCNDVIYSKTAGQYVECLCGRIFIDQTPQYCRIGGDKADYTLELDTVVEEKYNKDTRRWPY